MEHKFEEVLLTQVNSLGSNNFYQRGIRVIGVEDLAYVVDRNYNIQIHGIDYGYFKLCEVPFDELPDSVVSRLPASKIPYGSFLEYAERLLPNLSGVENGNVHKALQHSGLYIESSALTIYGIEETGDEKTPVKIFKNHKDTLRDRKTPMKFGRCIRYMFPHLDDATVEKVTKRYTLLTIKREYTLKVCEDRESFAHAYSDDLADSLDPSTTSARKSLHNSCMRGVLSDTLISPAEVYASGDFSIAWLEDSDGSVAGRVVIRKGTDDRNPQAGPVYGVCEGSLNQLEEYLDKIGADKYRNSCWVGAKLLRLEDCGGLIAPYLDQNSEADEIDGYLVLTNRGSIVLESTSGYVSGCTCDYCGGSAHEEEMTWVDNHGRVCEYCTDTEFTYVEGIYEYVHNDDVITVCLRSGGQTRYEARLHEDDEVVWCECVEEYWLIDHTEYSEEYEEFVPAHLVSDYPEMFKEEEESEVA